MSGWTRLIVNPAAGRGAHQAVLPTVRSAFAAHGIDEVYETAAPGDEENLAARGVRDGVQTLVCVGGDGTCSRVANAILRSGGTCSLAVVPIGTGNDLAKTLGLNRCSPEQIAELVVRATPRRIDVGLVDGCYFLNSCGFGFDPAVLAATKHARFLRGDALYICSALRQLFAYRGMRVSVDAIPEADTAKIVMLTISNGVFLGGAFRVAPQASAVDGQVDLALYVDTNALGRLRLFARTLRGTHLSLQGIKSVRVHRTVLHFTEAPIMEVDGELRQASSSTLDIECVARSLGVIAAPGFPR
jgi:YegS/Rv2252/BmrU family lipid kinase